MTNPACAEAAENVAPFARIVTWDASRKDGCRANRIQEFHSDDVFLESDVVADEYGTYAVPVGESGLGCIGLQWMERRKLTRVALRFEDSQGLSKPEEVQLEAWFGESQWQGSWQPLPHSFRAGDNVWEYLVSFEASPDPEHGTRKIRWIFPRSCPAPRVAEIRAYTSTEWETAVVSLSAGKRNQGEPAEISIYNGRITDPDKPAYRVEWDTSRPLGLSLRYAKPQGAGPDRTVVRLQMADGAFGIAVDDILERGPVYVADFGIVAIAGPSESEFSNRNETSENSKTILDRVRAMPDQVFDTALSHVHNPVQDNGPTMVSLACDNTKLIVEREGTVHFVPTNDVYEQKTDIWQTCTWSLSPQFGDGQGRLVERRLEDGWLPVPIAVFEHGGVRYRQRTYVAPYGDSIQGAPWLSTKALGIVEFTVENQADDEAEASLRVRFSRSKDEEPTLSLAPLGERVVVSLQGVLYAVLDLSERSGLASRVEGDCVVLSGRIAPKQSARCYVYIPTYRMCLEQHTTLSGGESLLDVVRDYWQGILGSAAQIQIPDKFLERVIRASQAHCLIAARNEGKGERIAPWIAAMSYGPLESEANSVIRGMDFLGHREFAQRSLEYFIRRYNDEGFLTTGYTTMGTGWHLWMLGEHYRLTRDKDWMAGIAPEVAKVCKWIVRQTEKTKKLDTKGEKVAEYGLMPPGVQADWNAFAYHFSLNGYFYAGLDSAARALADIGFEESERLSKAASKFRENISRAYDWTRARSPVYPLRDGTWVPAYPGQLFCPGPTEQFFPGEDGNRSWCYDVELGAHQMVAQGILPPDSREVRWMMNHMEDVQFLRAGLGDYPSEKSEEDWYNLGGFAKVQPYYCRNLEIYAVQDDVKPFIRSYFNTIGSLLNTENLSFWEHFHNLGAWNKTHETGYFLYYTRLMLAMERGDELWLAPFVTNNWMRDGMWVSLTNAPTFFGKVSYDISSRVSEGVIEAQVDCPAGKGLSRVVIRLRHPEGKPIKAVTVDGQEHLDFDSANECVYLRPHAGTMRVRAMY